MARPLVCGVPEIVNQRTCPGGIPRTNLPHYLVWALHIVKGDLVPLSCCVSSLARAEPVEPGRITAIMNQEVIKAFEGRFRLIVEFVDGLVHLLIVVCD